MPPAPRAQAALLFGAGGAGAATMLALVLADLGGSPALQARTGARLFALLLTAALAIGLGAAFRPGAPPTAKGLVALGALLWLLGLGADLFDPAAAGGKLLAAHAAAAVGGAVLAWVGAQRFAALHEASPS